MTRLLAFALALTLPLTARAAEDALDEVNAARAARGLPPFARDPALTAAAQAAADYRAMYRVSGHVSGGMGDFGFLPPGTTADAAGCGALPPAFGWGTCCTYENYQSAGAAVTMGPDGRRYMHLFVRRGYGPLVQPAAGWGSQPGVQPAGAMYTSFYMPAEQPMGVYPTGGYVPAAQPMWTNTGYPVSRRGFRR